MLDFYTIINFIINPSISNIYFETSIFIIVSGSTNLEPNTNCLIHNSFLENAFPSPNFLITSNLNNFLIFLTNIY